MICQHCGMPAAKGTMTRNLNGINSPPPPKKERKKGLPHTPSKEREKELPPPVPAGAAGPVKVPDTLMRESSDYFVEVWARYYGRKYVFSAGDGVQLARFIREHRTLVEADWRGIVDRYLARRDTGFVNITGAHSLKWLLTRGINQFTGPGPGTKPSPYREL